MNQPASFDFRLEGISKVYPGVIALDGVSLAMRAGEVLGLVGENGAGKSTLMKILGGVTRPTQGVIVIDGEEYAGLSVLQSQRAGVAFVHQELNIFDNLDVAGNIFLGREMRRRPFGLLDIAAMHDAVEPLLKRVGAKFRPDTPASRLSLAEQQMVEIAKALSVDARLVIMDEPTSCLTITETEALLDVIHDLKRQGIAVIFISHRLGEVAQCADRVVVLRDGQIAGELDQGEISHDAMIRLMIGRDLKSLYTPPEVAAGRAVLSVRNAFTAAQPGGRCDFDVRSGEILGMAGLIGAGRTELAEAIFGVRKLLGGEVRISGKPLRAGDPQAAIANGLYLVPEDRKNTGLILDLEIAENITLANLAAFARRGLVSHGQQVTVAQDMRRKLRIKTNDVTQAAHEMSGGNQQKTVLAKWLSMKPSVVIFDEPTRGIDVGSKSEIYAIMRQLADAGIGVMMISSDMEELIGVSDRVIVMREGSIAGELSRTEFSEHNILSLAVGKPAMEKAS